MNNLTGLQLVEQGIVMGPLETDNIQQHGVDLNLIEVEKITGIGVIPAQGKTQLAEGVIVGVVKKNESNELYWCLEPGTYRIRFAQGCKVPVDKMLLIRQRSSLLRNGAILHSSVFDAGFETDAIGTVILITRPIEIEYGARVAQIYAHNSNKVANLYNGQFQGS
jgi:dUTP pyrophosphatase